MPSAVSFGATMKTRLLSTFPSKYCCTACARRCARLRRASSSMGACSAMALFMSTAKTFRRLKDNEFALAEPYKIRTVRVNSNISIEELAKNSPVKKYPAQQLRLLNDLYPDKEPKPGQLLKIVQ